MRLGRLALLLLPLAACEPRGLSITDPPPALAAAANCDARAQRIWSAGVNASYRIEAFASGPRCSQDVVTLAVRAPDGEPLLAWAGRTMDLFGLSEAGDAAAMKRALSDWINQDVNALGATTDLPQWPSERPAPGAEGDEFPFYPEPWLDRPAYEQLRAAGLPLFVFPQGRESLAVYVLREGRLEAIGLQQFPG